MHGWPTCWCSTQQHTLQMLVQISCMQDHVYMTQIACNNRITYAETQQLTQHLQHPLTNCKLVAIGCIADPWLTSYINTMKLARRHAAKPAEYLQYMITATARVPSQHMLTSCTLFVAPCLPEKYKRDVCKEMNVPFQKSYLPQRIVLTEFKSIQSTSKRRVSDTFHS